MEQIRRKPGRPKKKSREQTAMISARILHRDLIKLTDFPSRNVSKAIRDFVSFSVSNKEIAERIYNRNDSIKSVIEYLCQHPELLKCDPAPIIKPSDNPFSEP